MSIILTSWSLESAWLGIHTDSYGKLVELWDLTVTQNFCHPACLLLHVRDPVQDTWLLICIEGFLHWPLAALYVYYSVACSEPFLRGDHVVPLCGRNGDVSPGQ